MVKGSWWLRSNSIIVYPVYPFAAHQYTAWQGHQADDAVDLSRKTIGPGPGRERINRNL